MPELDEKKLALEEKRLDLERQRLGIDARFVHKHFGVLMTAVVSVAAVVISAAQVWVSEIDKDREIELARLEQDRRWNLDLTEFLFRHKESIFSDDSAERERMRNLLVVAFPKDITAEPFKKLEATVPDEEKATWQQAQVLAQLHRVFVHIKEEQNRSLVGRIADTLQKAGFQVQGIERVDGETNGDVRYFHSEDEVAAEQVKNLVEKGLQDEGVQMDLKVIPTPRLASGVSPGTLEVWLPKLSEP